MGYEIRTGDRINTTKDHYVCMWEVTEREIILFHITSSPRSNSRLSISTREGRRSSSQHPILQHLKRRVRRSYILCNLSYSLTKSVTSDNIYSSQMGYVEATQSSVADAASSAQNAISEVLYIAL